MGWASVPRGPWEGCGFRSFLQGEPAVPCMVDGTRGPSGGSQERKAGEGALHSFATRILFPGSPPALS